MASAKPATAPIASAVGRSLTVYTVPDVPSESATSPGAQAERRARAAMLSPVPGPTTVALPLARPARAAPSTSGTTVDQSRSRSTSARRSSGSAPSAGDQ